MSVAVTTEFANAVSRQLFQPPFRNEADMRHWGWEQIASVKYSQAATEQQFGFTGIGAAVATDELEPAYYGKYQELDKTTWTHVKYTLGGLVSQELIEDNQNLPDIVGSLGKAIGEGHSYIVDYTVAQILNNAFTTQTTYDSVALCGTHTLQRSLGTVTNTFGPSSIDFDTLWLAINFYEYQTYTHEGLPMTDSAKYLIFHPSQMKEVRRALETVRGEPGSADNDKNTILDYGLVPVPCKFLSPNYWFVASSKFKEDLVFFWRIQKETKEDADFDRDAVKIKTRQRFSVNVRDWMHILGNQGA